MTTPNEHESTASCSHPMKLGISACLLGRCVRYDGGHKLDSCIVNAFLDRAVFVPVCPEVECGMSIPREPLRLCGNPSAPRLITMESGVDCTDRMLTWCRESLYELQEENLCGYIFKSGSPSCGLGDNDIYDGGSVVYRGADGLWAQEFRRHYPHVPVENERYFSDETAFGSFIARMDESRERALRNQSSCDGNQAAVHM